MCKWMARVLQVWGICTPQALLPGVFSAHLWTECFFGGCLATVIVRCDTQEKNEKKMSISPRVIEGNV